ncbi:MAG: NAD(P)-binding domain-containing protein, partial [Oscillospiraceae bacterium]|nr:NAD(P)-binding domain-containing protein [Oscillospiraceae bacterium]
MKIGFIGAGKVGFTLGKYFAENGMELSGYYSSSVASAKEAAEITGSEYFENA